MEPVSKPASRVSRGQNRRRGSAEQRTKELPNAAYLAAVKSFEAGVVLFQKQSYEKAREVFDKLSMESPPEVSSRAIAYLRMCEQKLAAAEPVRSPREHYDVGIAQLNARHLDAAIDHLAKAYKAGPLQEHVRYALAAAYALRGNSNAALEHLAAAIELRPANRYLAARDEDFHFVAGDPRFQELIRPGVA